MHPITIMATILVVLGALVLLFGRRMVVLLAGIGALFGVGILNLIPSEQVLFFAVLLVSGLALLGGIIGLIFKNLNPIIISMIGFFAGGAITFAIFDAQGFGIGGFDYLVALIGAGIGLMLAHRHTTWATIIIAAATGALLITRGLQLFDSMMVGIIGSSIWLILALVGFLYLSRDKRQQT